MNDVIGNLLNQGGAGSGQGGGVSAQEPAGDVTANSPGEQKLLDFISRVLATTEDVWVREYPRQYQGAYVDPKLIHFRDAVQSGCGYQTEQVGPFYCGADQTIYIDLTFFAELGTKYRAAGDFAQAYVIAHEVGHHVQQISGVSGMVRSQQQSNPRLKNQWFVRQELHADFLAGIWGHHVEGEGLLERGDLDEALNAAEQIGDDTLQKRATGRVQPDAFTHGTAAQRRRWFLRGFETGDIAAGDDLFRLPYSEL